MLNALAPVALLIAGQLTSQMQQGISGATFVPPYTDAQRVAAVQAVLKLSTAPKFRTVLLTPNAPYAADGSHLSFWKPSFVLGTASGGEVGVNFWGLHNEGHVNVGFTAATQVVLDCRMLSQGAITYKVYTGTGDMPHAQGEIALRDGHFLMAIPASTTAVSVELWPTPVTQTLGFLGCEIDHVE